MYRLRNRNPEYSELTRFHTVPPPAKNPVMAGAEPNLGLPANNMFIASGAFNGCACPHVRQ
jgi:hypothetical protein